MSSTFKTQEKTVLIKTLETMERRDGGKEREREGDSEKEIGFKRRRTTGAKV